MCTVVQMVSEWGDICRRSLLSMYETVTSHVECSAAKCVLSCKRCGNGAKLGGVAVRVCMRQLCHLLSAVRRSNLEDFGIEFDRERGRLRSVAHRESVLLVSYLRSGSHGNLNGHVEA